MPWPLKDGGAIAMYQLSSGLLQQNCRLTLAIPITDKHDVKMEELPDKIRASCDIYTTRINTRITLAGAFFNLFSSKPYYISRYNKKKFKDLLTRILTENRFDIIIFESLKVSPFLRLVRKMSNARIFLRSHNVEHLIWKRMAGHSSGLKKLYLKILSSRLEKYELETIPQFDGLISISPSDLAFFRARNINIPAISIPAGLELEKYPFQPEKAEKNTIFHIGALDWLSNLEAVKWFLEKVWPEIFEKLPHFQFFIAGRNTPEEIKKLTIPNVFILGEVENAIAFMQSRQIMIVPLLSGSGLKIKIVEGMALGKIIISTTVGAEGTGAVHQRNILIANTPEEFVNVFKWISEHPEEAGKIGFEARQHALQHFDNRMLMGKLMQFFTEQTPIQAVNNFS